MTSVGTYSFTDLLRDPALRVTDRGVDQQNAVGIAAVQDGETRRPRPWDGPGRATMRDGRSANWSGRAQNMPLSLAAVFGTSWITSQCSTTLPFSRRKKSASARPGLSGSPPNAVW
jgi:hypothetical protein